MKTLFQRLLRRENFVALLLVATAFISVLEIPQKFGVSETKLLLLMVGFLAIESLIVKIEYLESIEACAKRMEQIIVSHPNAVILQPRTALPLFPERIEGVKNVFVFAMSANALVMQYSRDIESALKAGTNFRFLIVSPDNPALQAAHLSSPTLSDLETQIRWINDTLIMLKVIAQIKAKGRLEVRLFQGLPTGSLIAYDVDRDTGWIQVESHIYKQAPASRPIFILSARSKNEWFNFYRKTIVELWSESQELSLL
jgi:hypothetical protein